jgi:hypothetical protein
MRRNDIRRIGGIGFHANGAVRVAKPTHSAFQERFRRRMSKWMIIQSAGTTPPPPGAAEPPSSRGHLGKPLVASVLVTEAAQKTPAR